ncbi:hypothetical protein FA95DRAFT_1682648 [Auriscalpium vulgare]|uniref:Uncharacterized protein n=1 Tax=Auriscalpium vulgare TaxID=40419 RepID=A0ACB8RF70_9AGAM|nr:hypothetical protein FA95DRAFT_1682648 [Auriscalpium vulgare]
MSDFPALPGLYQALFLYIEPASTILLFFMIWLVPGAAWFHHELIPDGTPAPAALDDRTTMVIWQLGNCCLLFAMLSSFVFRAVRDALPENPAAQERILGAHLFCMTIADATHIGATFAGLPEYLRYTPQSWNAMAHGNISYVVVLLLVRTAWFLGIGRQRYYFGQPSPKKSVKNS